MSGSSSGRRAHVLLATLLLVSTAALAQPTHVDFLPANPSNADEVVARITTPCPIVPGDGTPEVAVYTIFIDVRSADPACSLSGQPQPDGVAGPADTRALSTVDVALGALPPAYYIVRVRALPGNAVIAEKSLYVSGIAYSEPVVTQFLPLNPTSADRVTLIFIEPASCTIFNFSAEPSISGHTIVVPFTISTFPILCPFSPAHAILVPLPPLAAGTYRVEVRSDGAIYGLLRLTIGEAPSPNGFEDVSIALSPALPHEGDRITLTVSGTAPYCTGVPTFDPPALQGGNVLLNGHVAPPPPSVHGCDSVPWQQTFGVGPLTAGAYRVEVRLNDELAAAHPFTVEPSSTAMDLAAGRFVVSATWTGADGLDHAAHAVPLSDESGYFWFFDSGNVELTVKILDGTAVNGHHWLFIASMTDVAYTVRVSDTHLLCIVAGPPCDFAFSSPAGHNQNFIELDALAGQN